jgi:hypothetical protein
MPARSVRIRLIDIREEILWSIATEDLDHLDRAAEILLAGQPE